jgi:hypothetical protein
MHPIVETYQTKPEDFTPSKEQLDAHVLCCLADKEFDSVDVAEAKAAVTDELRELAEECKQLRRRSNYSAMGFCWQARIVDARTGEVLFDSPMAYKQRDKADRNGQRLIDRWRKTKSWTQPQGVGVSIK